MYKFNKKIKVLIIAFIIVIISMIGYYMYHINEESEFFSYEDGLNNVVNNEAGNSEKTENKSDKEKTENVIVVHVAGHVVTTGVIQLPENSRISDAIEKAGGLTEDADISKINLAYLLEDGMKIYIPSHNEIEEEKKMENGISAADEYITKESDGLSMNENSNINENTSSNKKSNTKININTATQSELESLPGVGSATAMKIISYRNENGKLKSVEDIKNVKGIGDSKFEKIKDFIYVK